MSTAKVKAAAAAPKAAAPQAANDTVQQIEQVVAVGKETVEQVVKASTETVEQVVKASKDAAAKAQTAALQSYEDSVAQAKDAAEAMVKAGTIFTQGLQDIAKQVFSLAQANFEDGVAASQKIFAAKTLHEVVDLQASVAKAQLDRLLAESSRLSDLSAKLVEESVAPLTERVKVAVDKLVKRAA